MKKYFNQLILYVPVFRIRRKEPSRMTRIMLCKVMEGLMILIPIFEVLASILGAFFSGR